jgi:hypothetical protein
MVIDRIEGAIVILSVYTISTYCSKERFHKIITIRRNIVKHGEDSNKNLMNRDSTIYRRGREKNAAATEITQIQGK